MAMKTVLLNTSVFDIENFVQAYRVLILTYCSGYYMNVTWTYPIFDCLIGKQFFPRRYL